jgi:hypothetical protein
MKAKIEERRASASWVREHLGARESLLVVQEGYEVRVIARTGTGSGRWFAASAYGARPWADAPTVLHESTLGPSDWGTEAEKDRLSAMAAIPSREWQVVAFFGDESPERAFRASIGWDALSGNGTIEGFEVPVANLLGFVEAAAMQAFARQCWRVGINPLPAFRDRVPGVAFEAASDSDGMYVRV